MSVIETALSRKTQFSNVKASLPDVHETLTQFHKSLSLKLGGENLDTGIPNMNLSVHVPDKTYPVIIDTKIGGSIEKGDRNDLIHLDTSRVQDSDFVFLTTCAIGNKSKVDSNFDVAIIPDWDIALSDFDPDVIEAFSEYVAGGGDAGTLGLKLKDFTFSLCSLERAVLGRQDPTIRDIFSECTETHGKWTTDVEKDGPGFTGKVFADLGDADVKLVYGQDSQYVEYSAKSNQRKPINMTLFFRLNLENPCTEDQMRIEISSVPIEDDVSDSGPVAAADIDGSSKTISTTEVGKRSKRPKRGSQISSRRPCGICLSPLCTQLDSDF